LIPKIRQLTLRQRLRRNIRLRRSIVRRGDAENGGDEVWVPLGYAVDRGAAPVMAAEDELRYIQLAGDGGDGVGVRAETVVT
jgi:hypothetical protein